LAQVVDAIKRLSGVHVHSAHAQQLGGIPWAVSCGGFSEALPRGVQRMMMYKILDKTSLFLYIHFHADDYFHG
ncbi:hypothetical protein, partial [Xylella fastidiosa]|uniref:hypothetical protein n=1 Tax=Xylella fastidiosa TaxID=2371 RepID=UPI0019D5249F